MSHRNDYYRRTYPSTRTIAPWGKFASTSFRFAGDDAPRLTRRSVTVTERCTIEVVERKTPRAGVSLFGFAPSGDDTTTKWSSESVTNIEETYE